MPMTTAFSGVDIGIFSSTYIQSSHPGRGSLHFKFPSPRARSISAHRQMDFCHHSLDSLWSDLHLPFGQYPPFSFDGRALLSHSVQLSPLTCQYLYTGTLYNGFRAIKRHRPLPYITNAEFTNALLIDSVMSNSDPSAFFDPLTWSFLDNEFGFDSADMLEPVDASLLHKCGFGTEFEEYLVNLEEGINYRQFRVATRSYSDSIVDSTDADDVELSNWIAPPKIKDLRYTNSLKSTAHITAPGYSCELVFDKVSPRFFTVIQVSDSCPTIPTVPNSGTVSADDCTDLPFVALGADFSNLLRCGSETPNFQLHLNSKHDIRSILKASTNKVNHASREEIIVVADTGASHGLTADEDDFVEITYGNFGSMSTAASDAKFPLIATGIVEYEAISENGDFYYWRYPANLCKAAGTRLCSPQVTSAYLNLDKRKSQYEGNHVYFSMVVNSAGERVSIPIDPESNLPLIRAWKSSTKSRATLVKQQPGSCPCGDSAWCRCALRSETKPPFQHEYEILVSEANAATVLLDNNLNLTGPQKQLLLDHFRLGHADFEQIQKLYDPHGPGEPEFDSSPCESTGIPCLIPRFRSCSSCTIPKCAACMFAKAKRRPTESVSKQVHPEARHLLKDPTVLKPGDLVSVDNYESGVRGRLYDSRGLERSEHKFCGGTIFYDNASKFISAQHQISLSASDTIRAKDTFELEALRGGVEIKRYHSDNGVFASTAFSDSLRVERDPQSQSFSGVGAKHQNGAAERAIQRIVTMARAMMLHCHLHWPDGFSPSLWPMAMDYAVWLHNHLPDRDTGLCPAELFYGVKLDCSHLRRARVWGAPTYVLDPKLQDGKKLPKWVPRSRVGQFLGFSPSHSSTVGMIRNLSTGFIGPQFHVLYDELFETVASSGSIDTSEDFTKWLDVLTRDHYLSDYDPSTDKTLPDLLKDWFDHPPSDHLVPNSDSTVVSVDSHSVVEGEDPTDFLDQGELPSQGEPLHFQIDFDPSSIQGEAPSIIPISTPSPSKTPVPSPSPIKTPLPSKTPIPSPSQVKTPLLSKPPSPSLPTPHALPFEAPTTDIEHEGLRRSSRQRKAPRRFPDSEASPSQTSSWEYDTSRSTFPLASGRVRIPSPTVNTCSSSFAFLAKNSIGIKSDVELMPSTLSFCFVGNLMPILASLMIGILWRSVPKLLTPIIHHISTLSTWIEKNRQNGEWRWTQNYKSWPNENASVPFLVQSLLAKKLLKLCGH